MCFTALTGVMSCFCTLIGPSLMYWQMQHCSCTDPDTECGGVSDIDNTVTDALLKLNIRSIKLDGEWVHIHLYTTAMYTSFCMYIARNFGIFIVRTLNDSDGHQNLLILHAQCYHNHVIHCRFNNQLYSWGLIHQNWNLVHVHVLAKVSHCM